ncbi:vera protein [Xylariaceae sp. FL1019]|nr:vera protein [Xylariaceae sp. FL1019]
MALGVTGSILLRAVAVVFVLFLGRSLYRGYQIRSKTRSLQAQGIPILPHSWFLGHLAVLGDFRNDYPHDVNFYTFHTWLINNCQKYFPGMDFPPPIVYLDIWPVEHPLAMVLDPVAASQFTINPSLPKMAFTKDFMVPLTQGTDIVSNEGLQWKTWRSRFNPGFSQRNLLAMTPDLLEEANVFVSQLEKLSGQNGQFGSVFQLEEKTTNLTFDIICRAALGMRLNEQTRPESSPLKVAFMSLIDVMNSNGNAARAIPIGRMPWQKAAARRNNQIIRDILTPQIEAQQQIGTNDSQVKTITDLAIKHINKDYPDPKEDKTGFVDLLISNLKAFLFAGHDTTSATICFMTKLLQDNPECMAKLRAEHDSVFGPDPSKAAAALAESPHLLYMLPYTLGVIKETLRFYPLAATLRASYPGLKLAVSGSQVQYPMDGYGMWVATPALHLNPGFWPRPNEFLPERWTVPEGDPLHASNAAYAPFSLGPRNCIGMELALLELRIVSVLVARRFEISEAWDKWDQLQGHKATPNLQVDGQRCYRCGNGIVHPKDGMPVHVRLREHITTV